MSAAVRAWTRRADAPDVLCATGQATMVWIDLQTGRPVSLPPVLHELWNAQFVDVQ